jgi:subtilisin family serine protease
MDDGTSMAAPFVSGVAGLIRSIHPTYPPVAVKNAILRGVAKPHSLAGGWTLTNGRLNAAKALSAPTTNATPVTDGSIAGAIALVHVRKGSLSYPAEVNDVFKAGLRKGHRYVARLVVDTAGRAGSSTWS